MADPLTKKLYLPQKNCMIKYRIYEYSNENETIDIKMTPRYTI